jgi:sarcosine oxidase, subunit beta
MTGSERSAAAEIVIVGAGVVGLSIAFHLAKRGVRDVVVIERDEIASGATAKATGGIRHQFSNAASIRLSIESVEFFEQFEERVGAPFLFRRHGYLFLLATDEQVAAFKRSIAFQNSLSVPTEFLAPQEIARRYPVIEVGDLLGGSFGPHDGSGSPTDAAYGFAQRVRAGGVRILEGEEVRAIEVERGRVMSVETDRRRVATRGVVNAAGPWAAQVAALAGVALPITPHPRQVFSLTRVDGLGDDFPLTVDLGTGVYVHQEPAGILLGGGDRDRGSSYEAALDWGRFDSVVEAVIRRVPLLESAGSISGWCGLRDMTPDDHPILGPTPGVDGLWQAAGFSGHGFMHAPAAGRILAEWIVDGRPSTDVDAFRFERFESPDLDHESVRF